MKFSGLYIYRGNEVDPVPWKGSFAFSRAVAGLGPTLHRDRPNIRRRCHTQVHGFLFGTIRWRFLFDLQFI